MNERLLSLYNSKRSAQAILATVLWEFFSYFGMRALLILYLTQSLNFSDTHANALYGSYLSLVFLTPIIGGWLADKYLGFKRAILIGCSLIIIGHLILAFTQGDGLYYGLAWLIIGVGFFKTNAICMISDCFKDFPEHQDSAYVWYYVFANVGATLGPIVCAIIAQRYGWHYGFVIAGIGMLIGVTILLSQKRYLNGIGQPPRPLGQITYTYFIAGILLAIGLTSWVLLNGWALWVLISIGVITLPMLIKVYIDTSKHSRRHLILIGILTLFATIFWAFDQQGGSSINLYILREVHRTIDLGLGSWTIPASWFQSINPAVIIIGGPLIAFIWQYLNRRNMELLPSSKIMIGMLLVTAGFALFIWGNHNNSGNTSMIWPILGLVFIGLAEIFFDPVILSEINKSVPDRSRGFITGMYYLFVGAYANYVSIQVANLSVYYTGQGVQASGSGYLKEFEFITVACISLLILLSVISILHHRLHKA